MSTKCATKLYTSIWSQPIYTPTLKICLYLKYLLRLYFFSLYMIAQYVLCFYLRLTIVNTFSTSIENIWYLFKEVCHFKVFEKVLDRFGNGRYYYSLWRSWLVRTYLTTVLWHSNVVYEDGFWILNRSIGSLHI